MSEIKVGDAVKIAEKVDQERYENSCGWHQRMVSLLGNEGTVLGVNDKMGWAIVGFDTEGRQWTWHLDDLKVVPWANQHPQAERIKEYAEDAATHDRPWELWERWSKFSGKWEDLTNHPMWIRSTEYRRKSTNKTVLVNGSEVAANSDCDKEDTARLNWIEENADLNIYKLRWMLTQEVYYEVSNYDDTIYGTGETVREAIDKARNHRQSKKPKMTVQQSLNILMFGNN